MIEIVENAEFCLVYDRPLAEHGLTWGELVDWWTERCRCTVTRQEAARALYTRLSRSLANEAERFFFRTYCERYARFDGPTFPALVLQVYLHYDPYLRSQLGDQPGHLKRQRMDFLLLLPRRARVVLEIDGVQHYTDDGAPSPRRYAEMVSEDRALRLARYEVYRFGGQELAGRVGAARHAQHRSLIGCSHYIRKRRRPRLLGDASANRPACCVIWKTCPGTNPSSELVMIVGRRL